MAFLLTGSSAVADELAQDACEQVLRRWNDISHPQAYARRAVVSGARRWGRRRTRHDRLIRAAEPTQPTSSADVIAVRDALADLPRAQRQVLVFRFYADLKVDDIASELGLRPGTVKSHIHRGLARMQEELS